MNRYTERVRGLRVSSLPVRAGAAVVYIVPVLLTFFIFECYFILSSVNSGIKG